MKPFGDSAGDALRNDEQVQTAARNLFSGCVPERENDLDALWAEYDLTFRLAQDNHDGDKVIMRGGLYRYVDFNHRTLRAFWVAGYAAWEGYSEIAESIAAGNTADLSRFKELVDAVKRIAASDSPESEPLPNCVAEPGQYDGQAVAGRGASELATLASCWALLHEVRHIQYQREGSSADRDASDPAERHKEELSCDRFATEFLLSRIDDYARDAASPAEKVRLKRETGIYFALFAMAVLTDGKFEDSETHPALEKRISAVQEVIGADGTCEAQVIARLAFDALRHLDPLTPSIPITLCA